MKYIEMHQLPSWFPPPLALLWRNVQRACITSRRTNDSDSLDLRNAKPGQCIPIDDVWTFKPSMPVEAYTVEDRPFWFVDANRCVVELAAVLVKYNFTLGSTNNEQIVLTRGKLEAAISLDHQHHRIKGINTSRSGDDENEQDG